MFRKNTNLKHKITQNIPSLNPTRTIFNLDIAFAQVL